MVVDKNFYIIKKSKLEINKLHLSFETRTIFRNLQLQVFPGNKVIIVGENGIGKSTLLKIIKGFNYVFNGSVKVEGTVGYLPQTFEDFRSRTVLEHLVLESNNRDLVEWLKRKGEVIKEESEKQFNALGGYKLIKILFQLKFDQQILNREFKNLSSGEKVKLHLATLMFQNPDILLLDEPTNHLDEYGLTWLEKFLKTYQGILVMVTHDRYLINQTANYISELSPETHNLIHFHGNYRNYLQEKEREYKRLKQLREQQEKEIKFIEKKLVNLHLIKSAYVINKDKRREDKMGFDARGARKHKSYKRIVNQFKNKKGNLKEKLVKIPFLFQRKFEINFSPKDDAFLQNISISLQGIEKSYQGKFLFKNLSFKANQNEKLVIKGANGTGKTTLLKIIMGIIKADQGIINISQQIKLGFLDQEQETINLNQTIIELLKNDQFIQLEKEEIHDKLQGFGIFHPQELVLPLSKLSIGCRRKVQIVKIILQGANVLILDEPTNHIDLLSLEKIEDELLNFSGTILVTSHDRYFIEKICNRVINIEEFK